MSERIEHTISNSCFPDYGIGFCTMTWHDTEEAYSTAQLLIQVKVQGSLM